MIMLLAVLFPSAGLCQEAEEANEEMMAAEKELELRHIQMEIQQSES